MRAELLAKAGACGSPTCGDPECQVEPGRCHREGCGGGAAIATHTSTPIRWVKDQPIAYCSPSCWARVRNTPDPARLRALESAGRSLSLEEAARRAQRAPSVLARHLDKLGLGDRVFGDGRSGDPRRVSVADIELVRAEISAYDGQRFGERDIEVIVAWYRQTFGKPMPRPVRGRYSHLGAKRNGTVVGRPRRWTPDEAQHDRIRQMRAAGKSNQLIANTISHEFGCDVTRYQIRDCPS